MGLRAGASGLHCTGAVWSPPRARSGEQGASFLPCDPVFPTGKVNVKDEELDAMLKEASGPINFTMFLNMFGEKLSGEPSAGPNTAHTRLLRP